MWLYLNILVGDTFDPWNILSYSSKTCQEWEEHHFLLIPSIPTERFKSHQHQNKFSSLRPPSHPQKKFTKFHLYCRKPDKLPPVTMKEVMTKPEWVSLYLPEPLDNSIYSQLQEKVTNVNSTVRSQIFLYQFLHMKYEYGKIVKQLGVCQVFYFLFFFGVFVFFFLGGGWKVFLWVFFLIMNMLPKVLLRVPLLLLSTDLI